MIDTQGKLLIAPPNMPDPRFRKTVVYIWRHDVSGAAGVVINKKMPSNQISNTYATRDNTQTAQGQPPGVLRWTSADKRGGCATQHRIHTGQHQHPH